MNFVECDIIDQSAILKKEGAWVSQIGTLDLHPELARYHGLQALLGLQEDCRELAARELLVRKEIERVFAELTSHGIDAVVFKGTALAYQVYAEPWHRPRTDTDLFIRESDRTNLGELLQQLGYEPSLTMPGSRIVGEQAFVLEDAFGVTHNLDVHWRFNNSPLLQVFEFDELLTRSLTLDAVHRGLRVPCLEDAMLIAAVHRAAHYHDVLYLDDKGEATPESDRLIWIYDIHLLAGLLDKAGWHPLMKRAIEKKVGHLVADGLGKSVEAFGTVVAEEVLAQLRHAENQIDPVSLRASRISLDLAGMSAVESLPGKLRWLGQHLFPPVSYLKARYGVSGPRVYFYYVSRLAAGLYKRLVT